MKTEEREWARELRRHRAMSVKEIARVVGVAPSSVSLWVRDIPLTADQLESLRQRNPAYIHSTAIVQSIYGSIQEYGGFERPEWLG